MLTGSQRETLGRCNMRITRFLSFGAVVALASAGYLTATRTRLDAQQPASVKLKPDEIGGVVSSQQGTRSGRLGDRRNHRSAHALHQGSGHRRSGPLPDSRSAQGKIHRLGARLRTGGFAQDRSRDWQVGQSETDRCAGRQNRRATLSRELLVRAAQGAREERIPRHWAFRQRDFAEHHALRASGST